MLSWPTWVLGTELRTSSRARHTLNLKLIDFSNPNGHYIFSCFIHVYLCEYRLYMCRCAQRCQGLWRWHSECCEPSNMGGGTQSQTFWKHRRWWALPHQHSLVYGPDQGADSGRGKSEHGSRLSRWRSRLTLQHSDIDGATVPTTTITSKTFHLKK